jgi:dethiobiotin synthetase
MAACFVTGSGPHQRKTRVAAQLLRFWAGRALHPEALKPVATGYDPAAPQDADAAALLEALGRAADAAGVEAITPYRFAAPLSPDQAAAREGGALSLPEVLATCRAALQAARGPMLVEGAGGAMTPLNDGDTMLDLALGLDIPVLFVAGSYLGAISHALTGLAALRAAGVKVALVLINETPGSSVGLDETLATMSRHAGAPVIAMERGAPDTIWAAVSSALGVG